MTGEWRAMTGDMCAIGRACKAQTFSFLYSQQEAIYLALYSEVSEAKAPCVPCQLGQKLPVDEWKPHVAIVLAGIA